jgi:hypothetical protein
MAPPVSAKYFLPHIWHTMVNTLLWIALTSRIVTAPAVSRNPRLLLPFISPSYLVFFFSITFYTDINQLLALYSITTASSSRPLLFFSNAPEHPLLTECMSLPLLSNDRHSKSRGQCCWSAIRVSPRPNTSPSFAPSRPRAESANSLTH